MFVQGGLDTNEEFLNDLRVYDIPNNYWIDLNSDSPMPFLSHHSMAACFSRPKKLIHLIVPNNGNINLVKEINTRKTGEKKVPIFSLNLGF